MPEKGHNAEAIIHSSREAEVIRLARARTSQTSHHDQSIAPGLESATQLTPAVGK